MTSGTLELLNKDVIIRIHGGCIYFKLGHNLVPTRLKSDHPSKYPSSVPPMKYTIITLTTLQINQTVCDEFLPTITVLPAVSSIPSSLLLGVSGVYSLTSDKYFVFKILKYLVILVFHYSFIVSSPLFLSHNRLMSSSAFPLTPCQQHKYPYLICRESLF